MIKLILLDVDGTLTDGGIYLGNSGEELKKFSQVEHPHTGPGRDRRAGHAAPHAHLPQAHDVVAQVVAACDGVEHACDLAGVLGEGGSAHGLIMPDVAPAPSGAATGSRRGPGQEAGAPR